LFQALQERKSFYFDDVIIREVDGIELILGQAQIFDGGDTVPCKNVVGQDSRHLEKKMYIRGAGRDEQRRE